MLLYPFTYLKLLNKWEIYWSKFSILNWSEYEKVIIAITTGAFLIDVPIMQGKKHKPVKRGYR
jgi:hypothetical protein